MARPSLEDRFWASISPEPTTGCWLWTGSINPSGYGSISVNDRTRRAHRIAWIMGRGPIPYGMHVLHKCDNRACVNFEDHLYLGDNFDNQADMHRRGRTPPQMRPGYFAPEEGPSAKLTWEQVREIRRTYVAGGTSQASLARQFGVAQASIGRLLSNQTWEET